jgi:hypothetical protein
VLQLHLLVLNLLAVSLPALDTHLLESVVVAAVVVQLLVEEVDDLITGHVKELTGVRHDHHCALAAADIVFQPHDSVEIQMVGGFIQ